MDILQELANAARCRVKLAEETIPLSRMHEMALSLPAGDFAFEKALRAPGLSFICECKKASPSKGLIDPDFPYLDIAKDYQDAGADAISVLTEPTRFLGDKEYLREIAEKVSLPCLRKDFIVDEYMIYESRVLGASAVLLICSLLSSEELANYIALCDCLGLSALVEVHSQEEIVMALSAGARIVGVNNRNLTDFTVDQSLSRSLRSLVPPGTLFVSESGVKSEGDIIRIRAMGADGVLIGEALMRAPDRKKTLMQFRQAAKAAPLASSDSRVHVKLCGLKSSQDILAANLAHPDYAGFVFAPKSKRYLPPEEATRLRKELNPAIRAVGVFVDAAPDRILELCQSHTIQAVQLHGSESETYIKALQESLMFNVSPYVPVIQAIQIGTKADVLKANQSPADLVLLDAGAGDGKIFDWTLLRQIKRPYVLAGGLMPENVSEAIRFLTEQGCRPFAVDVSSGIETAGSKDPEKMQAFIQAVSLADEQVRHDRASSAN
ncbi:MAG: indole-3-glycerol phosphate synthase TrpC [Firmicutes bacterium]|nr:indole-3-glycerol phosphate synthase TrpC [Bacillota bacterium]